jgi:hypothetical protein
MDGVHDDVEKNRLTCFEMDFFKALQDSRSQMDPTDIVFKPADAYAFNTWRSPKMPDEEAFRWAFSLNAIAVDSCDLLVALIPKITATIGTFEELLNIGTSQRILYTDDRRYNTNLTLAHKGIKVTHCMGDLAQAISDIRNVVHPQEDNIISD